MKDYLKRFLRFNIRLGFESYNNDLYYMGNELTYKIFLAIFPFLVFVIALISYLNIDTYSVFATFDGAIPDQVLTTFVSVIDVINKQESNSKLISISLALAIISASSGLVSIMRGINRTYGITKKRPFIRNRLISIFLVFVLVFSLLTTFILLVVSDSIVAFIVNIDILDRHIITSNTQYLYNFLKYSISIVVVLFTTMTIYNFSVYGKIPFFSTLPGSIFTMVFWFLSSGLYNYYIDNYSRYSSIYGNIGNLFILVFWINIIAIIILVGSQINAILYKDSLKNNHK